MDAEQIRKLVEEVRRGEEAMQKLLSLGRPAQRSPSPVRSERAERSIPERVLAVFKAKGQGVAVHLDDLCAALPNVLRTSVCSACGTLIDARKVRRTSLGWYKLL